MTKKKKQSPIDKIGKSTANITPQEKFKLIAQGFNTRVKHQIDLKDIPRPNNLESNSPLLKELNEIKDMARQKYFNSMSKPLQKETGHASNIGFTVINDLAFAEFYARRINEAELNISDIVKHYQNLAQQVDFTTPSQKLRSCAPTFSSLIW